MILCSGCFDGIHVGHVTYLEAAYALREPGETLAVAVAPDAYIRRVKGREPRWTLEERIKTLRGLSVVYNAFPHGEAGAADVIRPNRGIRLFVKGSDWSHTILGDVGKACSDAGVEIVIVQSWSTKHTSDAVSPHE